VDVAPSVRVTDADGDPVEGATVTFAVASGGGSVTGAQQTTGADGVATVGSWTLGDTPGANSLTASVSAGSASAQTFTATGVTPCQHTAAHTFGTTIAGSLTTTDCNAGGFRTDVYRFTVPASAQTIRVTQASDEIDAFLVVYDAQGRPIALADDSADANTNASVRILVTPGTYIAEASSLEQNETGAYSFTTRVDDAGTDGCFDDPFVNGLYITPGVTTSQQIRTTDCVTDGPGGAPYYSDRYFLFLEPNQSATIRMTSNGTPAIDPSGCARACPASVARRRRHRQWSRCATRRATTTTAAPTARSAACAWCAARGRCAPPRKSGSCASVRCPASAPGPRTSRA